MPTIKGNAKDNKLVGDSNLFGVTNYIYGYAGNDTLTGGFHADNFIWGGTGNDIIDGGPIFNRLYGEDGDDIIQVFWSGSDSELYGGAGNDQLIAGGGGMYLNGGTGADLMIGGDGGDIFVVDNARDRIEDIWVPEFDNQPNPIDTVRASVSYTLASNARIEVLETTDATKAKAINLSGNAVSQTIIGNAGDNVLDGKGGKDVLIGGLGADTLNGGAGKDVLIGGLGADTLNGGAGKDTASYATASSGLTVKLSKASANTGEARGDTYSSIENVVGTRFNDKLFGDALSNQISAGLGNDKLFGGFGEDILNGGSGNDKLNGGSDSDTLTGGTGNDIFVFDAALGAANIDRITDFRVVDDVIHLDNSVFKKLKTTGTLADAQFAANTSGVASDKLDRVIYETDTGYVYYDADGNGAGKAIHFATVTPGLSLTADDFFVI